MFQCYENKSLNIPFQYAKWTAQTTANDIVNSAATLALQSFDRAAIGSQNKVNTFEEMTLSPLADAANAIRNILSRAPNQFATPDALSTLESKNFIF